ncbi:MAG: hypothetical protein KatS3mg036_0721 [Ignavibacterium sp.]|nr:MAG: hypothetical protein KatS3mg036_0721 [Ignavibacterium sp.]
MILNCRFDRKVFYKNPQLIKISSEKFQLNKLKPIQFKSFTYHDFKLNKSALIKLKNGRSVSAEKFLNEVNEIEKKLNEFGYSLRNQDEEIILGRFNYSYDHLQRQSSLLNESARYSANENLRVTPCGLLTEKEIQSALKSGTPKESWPIKKNKNWSVQFGDDNFGIGLESRLKYSAEEKNSSIMVNADTEVDIQIKIFNENIPVLKLTDRVFNSPCAE